ncbi:MAG: TVP38/TMEM64 family protein [Aggregatilineales bacterium]
MQADGERFSLRAALLGIVAFVVATLLILLAVETIGVARIQDAVMQTGPLAPLAYIALKAATYIFAPLSAGPIQLSSGVLFGLWAGTFYSLLGEVIGGAISFTIARRLGRPAVQRFVGAEGMARVDRFYAQLGGWPALLYARLFLFSVYDFISYAAGFGKTITTRQYVLISAAAGFVPTFLFVAVGAGLAEDRSLLIPIYLVIGALSFVPLAVAWYRRRRSRPAALASRGNKTSGASGAGPRSGDDEAQ